MYFDLRTAALSAVADRCVRRLAGTNCHGFESQKSSKFSWGQTGGHELRSLKLSFVINAMLIRFRSCKRTSPSKIVENQSSERCLSADCLTYVSHKALPDTPLTNSTIRESLRQNCRTRVSHRRHSGLWRRGAIYQYRVRVSLDLRCLVGATHINRSLRTASFTEAVRLVRTIAFEI